MKNMNNMNMGMNNPFGNNPFEFIQNFTNQEVFQNMFKNWGDMNNFNMNNFDMNKFTMKDLPNMDFAELSSILQKNTEALSEAGKVASENFQSVSKKGSDSFQKNATEMFNSMKDAVSAGDMNQINDSTQKYIKKSVENNIDNSKEMMDIVSKTSMQMMDMMGNNITNNLDKVFNNNKQPKK